MFEDGVSPFDFYLKSLFCGISTSNLFSQLAWAPGKGMKGREWKDYWEVDYGVSYIPWSKLSRDTDFDLLEEGGMLDQETMPDWLKSMHFNRCTYLL